MSPKVKLTYFPLRARAEVIRLILAAGGIDFEEEVVQFPQWPAKKGSTPFGQMPVLTWDGEEIAQSGTIARFVARKTGLAGDSDLEMARSEMIADSVADIFTKCVEIKNCKDEAKKKELVDTFTSTALPNFLKAAERLLEKRGGKFFSGGGKLSYGDLSFFHLLDSLTDKTVVSGFGLDQEAILKELGACPHITELHKAIKTHPKVAAYLKQRPDYKF